MSEVGGGQLSTEHGDIGIGIGIVFYCTVVAKYLAHMRREFTSYHTFFVFIALVIYILI